MSSPTKSKLAPFSSYSIRPHSLTNEVFMELSRRLNEILRQVSSIRVDFSMLQPIDLNEKRKRLLRRVANYLSEVRLAQATLDLSPRSRNFDHHDQIASSALYKISLYENIRERDNPTSRLFIDSLVDEWEELLPGDKRMLFDILEHHKLRSPTPIDLQEFTPIRIGIFTALEQEYQSVIRRLDTIHACSGDYAHGLAIRYRSKPIDDLGDLSRAFAELGVFTDLQIGWTIGSVDSEIVVVICAGGVGKEHTQQSIKHIKKHLKLLVQNWLDVGVCAGSNRGWAIGTVLISHEKVLDLSRTGSERFKIDNVIRPLSLPRPSGDKFVLETSYRRVPRTKEILVSQPNDVPVYSVKFACVPDVIRVTNERDALKTFLVHEGAIRSGEEFGMEMEGAGTTLYGDSSTMGVIKGVSDYGDDTKKLWAPGDKVLFQLYAAETAADYAIDLVRNWDSKVEIRPTSAA